MISGNGAENAEKKGICCNVLVICFAIFCCSFRNLGIDNNNNARCFCHMGKITSHTKFKANVGTRNFRWTGCLKVTKKIPMYPKNLLV